MGHSNATPGMKRLPPRFLSILAMAALGCAAGPGCGDDNGGEIPPDSVAMVGDVVISKSDFDKWFRFTAQSPFLPGDAFVAAPPDPPSFSNCVSAKRDGAAPKRQRNLTDGQLRKRCEQEYAELMRDTMRTLIRTEWVQQEAADQGISVSAGAIERTLEKEKSEFRDAKAYEQFLEDAGITESDLRFRVKVDRLQEILDQRIAAKEPKVSDEDIAKYYETNKESFRPPERRNFTYVLASARGGAEGARQAVEDGESWKTVVKRYSIDPKKSKAQAIDSPKPEKGLEALERAVFRAAKGEIGGPVKTRPGWWVFEVTEVLPAGQQPLAKVRKNIAAVLQEQRRVAAFERFQKDYRSQTVCADDFKVPECRNGPKEKAS
jgi:parvulin-like peptidyl-prolyl isomerase